MRKNNGFGKKLNIFCVYKVSGLNLDRLVNNLKNNGVFIKDLKKTDVKTLYLAVNYRDVEKFFAITKDLCYNITYIKSVGKWKFLLSLKRNIGIAIGVLLLCITAAVADDFVFSVELTGTGSVYRREINDFLEKENIGFFSRFSSFDLAALSDKLLASSEYLTFAECYKDGNRLIVDTAKAENPIRIFNGSAGGITSDIDGEIESIKVYRGTALKNVGDPVLKGEEMCAGYAVIKDKTVQVGVAAIISVKGRFCYEYISDKDGEEDVAEIIATVALKEADIISAEVIKTATEDGRYLYTVTVLYRKLFYDKN